MARPRGGQRSVKSYRGRYQVVDGREPGGQRQLGVLEHRAGGERELLLAAVAGPPPEEWRDGIRTSRGRARAGPFHAGPGLGRGAVAQGRVQPLPIIEDLDV